MDLDQMGSRFLFAGIEFKIPLIGRHNVINTAMAIAISRQSTGISLEQCSKSLVNVKPVPGRLEPIEEKQPFGVFIDYAHTDDALRNVLKALREVTQGRLLLVFGCGGNRDKGKRIKMGNVASELADLVTITTDNPRREDPLVIAKQIAKGCSEIRNEGWLIELDRVRAIDEALRIALPGDTVLIAGKGHEAYQEFDGTVIPFDDGEQVRATLRGMRSGT
jgi:UDP-N-acetylmuramoyl-L-alanyl-D-glutamate--2,6-diaminopimelate ligase